MAICVNYHWMGLGLCPKLEAEGGARTPYVRSTNCGSILQLLVLATHSNSGLVAELGTSSRF